MKFVFDFDDTIFVNTLKFKRHIFDMLTEVGVNETVAREYYLTVRENNFSLEKFIAHLLDKPTADPVVIHIYEEIMSKCPEFLNEDLVEIIKSLGKENCYIASNGEKEFQLDKIERAGVTSLFKEIYTTAGSKKEIIQKICSENPTEEIIFIDDKQKFFDDLDMNACKNLKTILFDEQGLQKIKETNRP